MKTIRYIVLFMCSISCLLGCEKYEATPRDYPRIKTLPITELTTDGATFNAEIIYRGDFEILRYGFVWSRGPATIDSDRVVYSDNIQNAIFSERISTTLSNNKNHYVRAFAETADFLVYGEQIRFVAQGSQAPTLKSFLPNFGVLGDTITIRGEGFSFVPKNNIIRFGKTEIEAFSSTDTTIQVRVPFELTEEQTAITVEVAGFGVTSGEEFTLLTPNILDIRETDISYCETIHFSVANFPTNRRISALFQDQSVMATQTSPTEVTAVVPSFLNRDVAITPRLRIENFIVSSDKVILMREPTVEPKVDSFLNFHDTLTINHTNLEDCSIEVFCQGTPATFVAEGEGFTQVRIPADIIFISDTRRIPVKVVVQNETLFNGKFQRNITVTNLAPTMVRIGDVVRIEGEGFQPILTRNTVYLKRELGCSGSDCSIQGELLESSSRHILFRIPENIEDVMRADRSIYVRVFTQNYATNAGILQLLP